MERGGAVEEVRFRSWGESAEGMVVHGSVWRLECTCRWSWGERKFEED